MKLIKNLFYLLTPIILGTLIGILTSNSIDYNTLNKPPLSPPPILFPIIWSIIYILIGISYYLFKKNSFDDKLETIIYYIQLLINYTWSILFFTLKLRFFSIIWILLLIITIYLLISLFKQKNKVSAYLLIPYLLWCIYATYLNIGVYILNS